MMSMRSDNLSTLLLLITLCISTFTIISINSTKNDLRRSLKKITRELNNERIKYNDYERKHKASLVLNLVPTSFSNFMLQFCEEEDVTCPFSELDFKHVNKLLDLYAEEKYDKILKFSETNDLTEGMYFPDLLELLKNLE